MRRALHRRARGAVGDLGELVRNELRVTVVLRGVHRPVALPSPELLRRVTDGAHGGPFGLPPGVGGPGGVDGPALADLESTVLQLHGDAGPRTASGSPARRSQHGHAAPPGKEPVCSPSITPNSGCPLARRIVSHGSSARWLFGKVPGMTEVAKPAELASRCGAWFRTGQLELHLGVEGGFAPAGSPSGHPDRRSGCRAARLEAAGLPVEADGALPGHRRFSTTDCFRNHLEFLQPES